MTPIFCNFVKIEDMILKGSQMKTRKFEYKPRYYDAQKEERDAKKKHQADPSIEGSKRRISSSFERTKEKNIFLSGEAARSNKRIMIIVLGLAFLAYLFVIYVLPSLLELLG